MNIQDNTLWLNNKLVSVDRFPSDDGTLFFTVESEDIVGILPSTLREKVILSINLPSQHPLSLLFKTASVKREGHNIIIEFGEWLDGETWLHLKWSQDTYAEALIAQAKSIDAVKVERGDYNSLSFLFTLALLDSEPINVLVEQATKIMWAIAYEAEIALAGGVTWKKAYEENELLFCTEVLTPLLRKMRFLSVRYRGGSKEYGKDFTFSELTRFEILRHYGLQAKAGNVRGNVKSDIDEILGQLEDAFSMPYYEVGSGEPRYISTFVVAISGRFTENAKEKIAEKIPKGLIGSVYFLDKERILEFIDKFWSSISYDA